MSTHTDPRDWSEVTCRVEGCPRTVPGWIDRDEMCGLARIYGINGVPAEVPECGSVATVDKWIAMGLFDD